MRFFVLVSPDDRCAHGNAQRRWLETEVLDLNLISTSCLVRAACGCGSAKVQNEAHCNHENQNACDSSNAYHHESILPDVSRFLGYGALHSRVERRIGDAERVPTVNEIHVRNAQDAAQLIRGNFDRSRTRPLTRSR